MVDGSEGGKTGINFYGTKNIIGTFTQPTKILRNIDFIKTLTHREILSGWAEIIKHGIIQGGNIWEKTQNGIPSIDETQNWMEIIRENVSFKQDVVSDDFREKGKRKLLNLATGSQRFEVLEIVWKVPEQRVLAANQSIAVVGYHQGDFGRRERGHTATSAAMAGWGSYPVKRMSS